MYQLEWGAGNSVISVLPADRGRGLADFTGFQMSVAGSPVGGEPSPKGGRRGGKGEWGGLEPDHKEDGQFPKQLIEDRPGALEGMAVDGDVVEEDSGHPGGGRACQLAAAAGAAGSVMGGRRSQQAQQQDCGPSREKPPPHQCWLSGVGCEHRWLRFLQESV